MRKRRLILRQIALFLAVFLALAFLFQSLISNNLRVFLFEQRQREIRALLDPVKERLSSASFENPAAVPSLFAAQLRGRFAIRRITVLDPKGRIVASSQPDQSKGVEPSAEILKALTQGQSGFFVRPDEPGQLHFLITVTADRKVEGGVKISFLNYDIENAVDDAVLKALIAAFILLFVLFIPLTLKAVRSDALHTELTRAFEAATRGHFTFEPGSKLSGDAAAVFGGFGECLSHIKKRDDARQALFEKAKSIATVRTFSDLFDKLALLLKSETGADRVLVLLIKDESLHVAHVSGFEENAVFVGEAYRIEEDLFTEAIEFGRPLLPDDPSEIRVNARYRSVLSASGRTALFPVTIGNDSYGLIHAGRPRDKGPWQDTEVDAGALLAGGAGVGLFHLTEESDRKKASRATRKLGVVEMKGALSLRLLSHLFPGPEWAEVFEWPGDKGTEACLILIAGSGAVDRTALREQVKGMLLMAAKLKSGLGNLSFFALSILMRRPPSTERDSLLKQFKESPFSSEGIRSIVKGLLEDNKIPARVSVVRLNPSKKRIEAAVEGLVLFRVARGKVELLKSAKETLGPDDLIAGLPEGLYTEADLELFAKTVDPAALLIEAAKWAGAKADKNEALPGLPAAFAAKAG